MLHPNLTHGRLQNWQRQKALQIRPSFVWIGILETSYTLFTKSLNVNAVHR